MLVIADGKKAVAAAGTKEAIEAAKAKLIAGEVKVFDTATEGFITVEGAPLASYLADVDTDANFEKDTEVIKNGIFFESKFRAAPYFDVEIDGINLLDRNYG